MTLVHDWAMTLGGVRLMAPSTVARYRREVERMLRTLGIEDPLRITPQDLERYLQGRGLSGAGPTTMAVALAAIKSYCQYLCGRGIHERSVARHLQGPRQYRPEPSILTVGEARRLVYPDPIPADPLAARAAVHVALAYAVGLRAGETGYLRLSDLRWDSEERTCSVLIRRGKWAAQDVRLWVYDRRVWALLAGWLTIRDVQSPWLFPSRRGGPISARTANRDLRSRLRACRIRPRGRHLTYKVLRHSLASHLAARGASLRAIAQLLRHRHLRTTARYVHTTPTELAMLWRSHHPLAPAGAIDVHRLGRALHRDLADLLLPG